MLRLFGCMVLVTFVFAGSKIKKDWISNTLFDVNTPMKIPKKIHQIWFDFKCGDGTKVTERYQRYTETLRSIHPDWEYRLWDEESVIQLISEHFPERLEMFKSYDVPVKKHDFARFVICYVHGGVYVDHDYIFLKRFEHLLGDSELVFFGDNTSSPFNGFIGTIPGHDFLRILIDKAPSTAQLRVLEATGPWFVKNELEKCFYNYPKGSVRVLSHEFTMPALAELCGKDPSREELAMKYPDTVMIQLFDNTWVEEVPRNISINNVKEDKTSISTANATSAGIENRLMNYKLNKRRNTKVKLIRHR